MARLALSMVMFVVATLACREPSSTMARAEQRPAQTTASAPVTLEACKSPGLPQSGLRRARVQIVGDSSEKRFDVEVAETNRQRTIGMMCRTSMGEDEGMLFVFDRDEPRSFWMKNTLIALDMVFIDEGGLVVGVVEEAAPLTLTSRSVPRPATYVLELVGGSARRHGIREGARVTLEGVHSATANDLRAPSQDTLETP